MYQGRAGALSVAKAIASAKTMNTERTPICKHLPQYYVCGDLCTATVC